MNENRKLQSYKPLATVLTWVTMHRWKGIHTSYLPARIIGAGPAAADHQQACKLAFFGRKKTRKNRNMNKSAKSGSFS